jgi:2-oxo-4-hydroxy-4-carboxy--5-ureidoimidazoline (OHCU) decarboxylase
MSSASLPDVASLSSQPTAVQTGALDSLFEPSPVLYSLVLPTLQASQFATYNALIDFCHSKLLELSTDKSPEARQSLHSILGSHPRLGAKKVDSAQSSAEQAQLNRGNDGTELANLNAEYEAQFPGLRYVVFVNGRGRPEIMANMRERIARGNIAMEEQEGIQVRRSFHPIRLTTELLTVSNTRPCATLQKTELQNYRRPNPRPVLDFHHECHTVGGSRWTCDIQR